MMVPSSLRGRFLLASALTVGLALALTAALLVSLFSANIARRIDAELSSHVNTLAGAITFSADGHLERPKGPVDQRFDEAYGGLYWQIADDRDGETMRSRSLWDTALPLPADRHEDGAIHRYTLPGPDGTVLMVQERVVRVASPGGQRAVRIAVAVDEATLEEARGGFIRDIAPVIAVLGIVLIAASLAQLAFGLRALTSLSEGINRIRERRDTRLTGTYPSEFRTTVTAVNHLLETQGVIIEKARARAADLAHGLRTPLTVLSNDALTLRDRGETALADELDHLAATMRAHVERELALSRISARPDLRRADTDLDLAISEIIRILKRTPAGEKLDFVMEGPKDTTVPVDPGDFRELAGNLIENAVKWARGRIEIGWRREGQGVILTLADDGPGVPEEALENLTRRGWRLDTGKPGSGLGLSIVREIADVYGLGFTLSANPAGPGLTARLVFPDTASPPPAVL